MEKSIEEIEQELKASQTSIESNFIKNLQTGTDGKTRPYHFNMPSTAMRPEASDISVAVPSENNIHTEKLLLSLFETRDELIEAFSSVNRLTKTADRITNAINKLGGCIEEMGGEVEEFDPIKHVSGLKIPDYSKNIGEVIDRTRECYSLGSITKVSSNANTIEITFEGEEENFKYSATGMIKPLYEWSGNEAIDYVYTPGSGRMAVKAFEDGEWKDKSAGFEVDWDLVEEDTSQENVVEKSEDTPVEKKEAEKKENTKIAQNNEKDDMNDDFAIIAED